MRSLDSVTQCALDQPEPLAADRPSRAADFVGLPATCSYPMAVFLYRRVGPRPATWPVFGRTDYLRDPAAKFVVLQESAAAGGRALPAVRTTIEHEFDCQHPVARNSTYVLCPRR